MSSPLPFPRNDDDVLAEDQSVGIPEWHLEFLDEAIARYNEVGIEGTPWEEVKKELQSFIEHEVNNRTRIK